MVNFRRKKRKGMYRGGYKAYRNPRVFSGKKIKPKKEFHFPKISFQAFKKCFYILTLAVIIYIVFYSPKFAIKDVIVEGNNLVTTGTLKSYIPTGTNIFRFRSSKTKMKIAQENPEINSIQIIRGIPNAVKIVVSEHDNKIIWQSGNDKYLISTQGKVTKKIKDGENFNLPIVVDDKALPITLGENLLSPSFIAFITNINSKFFDYTNIKPTTYEITETTFDVNVHTEAGFYVKLNSLRSSTTQLENLKKVLVAKRADIHQYVDLRIDGWAYYQ